MDKDTVDVGSGPVTISNPYLYITQDGSNYIYFVLNGNIKQFTIKYKSNNSEPERTIIINNNAELAAE